MKILNWRVILGLSLILLSAAVYYLHYLLFHDAHHIFIYLVGDIAFVFIEVLLVTMVIHQLLNEWEKKSKLKKLNMVIETFFSEFGKQMLLYLADCDKNLGRIKDYMERSARAVHRGDNRRRDSKRHIYGHRVFSFCMHLRFYHCGIRVSGSENKTAAETIV